MKIQNIQLKSIGEERTLRYDFDYHYFYGISSNEYYKFEELFEIAKDDNVDFDNLFEEFQYCEIGNTDKNGEITPVTLDFSKRNLLDENYYKKIEKGDIISASKDDILIAKVRPNLKKYIRVTPDIESVYFTSAFLHLKAKAIPEIMYYCFRNLFYNNLMAISRQGKGYPTLSETDIRELKFSKSIIDTLINKKETLTNQIVCIESEISSLKHQTRTQQDIIDSCFGNEFGFDYDRFETLKAVKIFHSNNSDFSNNPDLRFSAKFHRGAGKFVMEQLNIVTDKKIKHYLSEPIVLGASISPDNYSDDGDGFYISMATIKSWSFNSEEANTISDEYAEAKSEKTVRKNDIILARSGEGTIGKVALIDNDDINGVFADFTMRIRLKNYNPEFAYYFFRTSYFQYLVEVYKKGLGNNTNIFPVVIQEFPLIDISLEEQQRIVDEIHSEIKKQDEINEKIVELRSEIDKIIEKAIVED
ncbi:MAG: restriction endonuclease subunit S [Eubacterium sp.]|nr:restriction endonuclease subunit S [Eubacterium sp.]